MRLLISIFFLSLLLLCCQKKNDSVNQVNTETKQLPKVIVTTVKKEVVRQKEKAYGQTKPFKTIDVFSKVKGLVIKKDFELGQIVKSGDVLAVVRQDIPGMEFADYELAAPINGLVFQDFIEQGATVTVQRPAFSLAQLNPILIEVRVPEEWQTHLNLKQQPTVRFTALEGQQFTASFYHILPQHYLQTHSLIVQLKLENPNLQLKSNMFATVDFTFIERTALTIPTDALIRSGLEYFVFTVENNQAQKQFLQVGQIFAKRIEVVSGLNEGQKVVVFGQNLLDDGVSVEVEEQP